MTSLRHRRILRRTNQTMPVYQVTNRLCARSVQVTADEIAATVSAWLAELGTDSPLVDDLVRAVEAGNWPAAHAISEHLSVRVTELPAA
ncbi:MAG: hypothetical protein P4L86_17725 [Mycobacterium sp.]|nr:hypothetical protein [Mycobacterium sp.]